MAEELRPEDVLENLEEGHLAPFYLFYGAEEFRLERALDRIRGQFLAESARDFNLEVFYGGEKTAPAEIVNHARSLPFLANNRLIVVRRTEDFAPDELQEFLPYLEQPVESTCLIFVSSKPDFRKSFYKKIRAEGRAVNFKVLKEGQVVPWIKRTGRELGLEVDGQACAYLHQIVGNKLRDLCGELEKLYLRYGKSPVGVEQVKELAIHSRVYTIFQLMNRISERDLAESLEVLNRFLEEEEKRVAPLQVLGMLNRQLRVLWQTKSILTKGGQTRDVAKELGLPPFSAKDFVRQSKYWSVEELERGLSLLYRTDGLLKTGSRPKPVLEDLVVSLCG